MTKESIARRVHTVLPSMITSVQSSYVSMYIHENKLVNLWMLVPLRDPQQPKNGSKMGEKRGRKKSSNGIQDY